jgi:hypothetical protein
MPNHQKVAGVLQESGINEGAFIGVDVAIVVGLISFELPPYTPESAHFDFSKVVW